MSLESLSNELLLDLFEYFPGVSLLHAFFNLNDRFDSLVFVHFQSHDLNFRSSSQYDFNRTCHHYLPKLNDSIVSLTLSNDDDTPQQIDLFLQYNPTLSIFINLRSLSICDLCSDEIMIQLMMQWKYLENLTRLTLAGCYLQFDEINSQELIDSIWILPKLTYCYLNISFDRNNILVPTIMSKSLKYLFIWGVEHHQNNVYALLKQTPFLEHFSILLDGDSIDDGDDVQEQFLSITRLTLSLSRTEEDKLIKFLQKMPNLQQIILDISILDLNHTNSILNGYQWEQIIRNYLVNLEIFRFRIEFQIKNEHEREENIDNLIDSFRNPFWLNQHHWFVRCHWNPVDTSSIIYLYTLPYSFNNFVFDHSMKVKSTSTDDNNYMYYNHVNDLKYEISFGEQVSFSSLQFVNLQTLSLKLPVNEHLWSMVPHLDRINSLIVSFDDNTDCGFQLQRLIDRMPHLNSLGFSAFSLYFPPISSLKFQNTSIRQLDLRAYNRFLNDDECMMFSQSLLGAQCESLFIKIKNHRILFDLLRNMIQLRTLNVQCEDDQSNLIETDELIFWLKEILPPSCVISRDLVFTSDIRIWIQ